MRPQLLKVGSVIVGLTLKLMIFYWQLLSCGFQFLISMAFSEWDGLDSCNVADALTYEYYCFEMFNSGLLVA